MAQYPTSAATDANLYVAVNSLSTSIVGALTSSGGNNGPDIEVTSTSGFPAVGFITIDQEAISYTSILSSPPRFSGITRGADGTIAASHSAGATAKHNIIAAHHNAPKDEVIAIENDLVAAKGVLNDNDTPAATATDIKDRMDQLATQIKAISGQANWYSTIPSRMGKILQIVMGTSTTAFSTTSSTFQTSNLSATITPSRTDSKVLILAFTQFSSFASNSSGTATIARDGTNILGTDGQVRVYNESGARIIAPCSLGYLDSPASTSALTYAIQIHGPGGVTVELGDNDATAVILLIEVAA